MLGVVFEFGGDVLPGLEIGDHGVRVLVDEIRRRRHQHRHAVEAGEIDDRNPDAVGDGDRIVGLDIDHGVDGLGRHGGDHVVDVHPDLLEVGLADAELRPDRVDEHVADGRADLVGDLLAFEIGDRVKVQVLAGHDLRGLADIFDQRDGDEAAFVVADQERLPGIGAEIDLAAHHLLHGEIAGRHGELLEFQAAFFERAGLIR